MKGCAQWGAQPFAVKHCTYAVQLNVSLMQAECSAHNHIFARLTHGRTIHEIFLKQMKIHSPFQKKSV